MEPMKTGEVREEGLVSPGTADPHGRPYSALLRGVSPAARSLWEKIGRLARTPYPLLLVGETGTGKTVLAREVHALSRRSGGAFVAIGATGIAEELRHGILCGSARGGYTGALDRPGALELASGGTLFLDELGYASPGLQQTLLTYLESNTVQRIGEGRTRCIDVRYVFATTADLGQRAREGTFLPELMQRVGQFSIQVPPLRERRADILPMAQHFLHEALREQQNLFRATIGAELAHILTTAPWPGNIRELIGTCRSLALGVQRDCELGIEALSGLPSAGEGSSPTTLEERIRLALVRSGGNKARAARELCMSRTALYRKFDFLGERQG